MFHGLRPEGHFLKEVPGPPIIDSRELSKMLIPGPILPRSETFSTEVGTGHEQDYILKKHPCLLRTSGFTMSQPILCLDFL